MIGLTELAVLGAASYRGVQLLVWDTVTRPMRNAVGVRHALKPSNKVWWFLDAVLGCVYCCGAYISAITVWVYWLATGTWGDASWPVHGLEWFAIMGIAALLNRWDDNLGDGH